MSCKCRGWHRWNKTTGGFSPVFSGSDRTRVVATGLTPDTTYVFAVQVYNVNVSTPALYNQTTATTPSPNPEAVSAPVVLVTAARGMVVRVDAPAIPNGDIENYTVSANGVAMATTTSAGNVSLTGLTPFTR